MFEEYCTSRHIAISEQVTHNQNGWYTTSLFNNTDRRGAPLLVNLHHNLSVLLSVTTREEMIDDAIHGIKNMPSDNEILSFSSLSEKTQEIIYRILCIGFADEFILIHDDDPWWNNIDASDCARVDEELRRLDGTAYGSHNWKFRWSFDYSAIENRHLVVSQYAYQLIHWDTVDPLAYIRNAPCASNTIRDTLLLQRLGFLPQVQTTAHTYISNVPRCPTCSSVSIRSIRFGEKAGSVALWGVFSQRAQKQFHCNSCGYEW